MTEEMKSLQTTQGRMMRIIIFIEKTGTGRERRQHRRPAQRTLVKLTLANAGQTHSAFTEAGAIDEGKRKRQRGSRSQEARQRPLGRGEPYTVGHEGFTILHSNVRKVILRVAELSARLQRMESNPSVLCLTENVGGQSLPTMRVEGYTPVSRHDRPDGRQGGGVAVFALERLDYRVTVLENPQVAERS